MKNIRIVYEKNGRMRFISHLDMNRFFTRILRKTELPCWYTEGYNRRLYLTFALPLSLGFESEYEVLDFRLEDDAITADEVKSKLESVLPPGIVIRKIGEPIQKAAQIRSASYRVLLLQGADESDLKDFLLSDEILIEKKNKKKQIVVENVAPKIIRWNISPEKEKICLHITLPAGNETVNPSLLMEAFFQKYPNSRVQMTITRTGIYDEDGTLFF